MYYAVLHGNNSLLTYVEDEKLRDEIIEDCLQDGIPVKPHNFETEEDIEQWERIFI